MFERLLRKKDGTTALARPRTYLHFVLDESGSMAGPRSTVIAAVNDFLHSQRYQRIDELFVTATKFADPKDVVTLYKGVPIEEAPDLTTRTYRPHGGTALYDGVAQSIADATKLSGEGDRVLMVIVTDGDENASKQVTLDELLRIKGAKEETGRWTFTLLGLGFDASHIARRLQINIGNVHQAGTPGEAMAKVDASVRAYRQGDALSTEDFYNPPQTWSRPNWASSPSITLTDDD